MNKEFWSGRRVFVTGHTGFKGSWLSLWLDRLGADVTGYALEPPTDPSLFVEAEVASVTKSQIADVRDREQLQDAVRKASPEVVFHLAAQPLVRESFKEPVETFETNVLGTVHLLEAVRSVDGIRAVAIITSDKCYRNTELAAGYVETDPMGGDDPYSCSKGCAELVSSSYRTSFFRSDDAAAIATARAGNVVGGGDWAKDRLIPDIVSAMTRHEPVVVRNPDAVRPWQHVLEPLHGYLLLAEALAEGRGGADAGWNFGPDTSEAQPVSWIVEHMTVAWGDGASWVRDTTENPPETGFLTLNADKARRELAWKPRLNVETTLQWTADWYRRFTLGTPAHELCMADIDRYEQLGA